MGHSRGTAQAFVGASMIPEWYKAKINLFVALAPITRTTNITNKYLQELAPKWPIVQFAAERTHAYNILGVNWYASQSELFFCGEFEGLCQTLLASFADADPSVDNMDRFERIMANIPAGSSYQDLTYFAQTTVNEDYHLFDYGRIENHKRYGQYDAPLVPLENISIPVALFQGSSDELSVPDDVQWLAEKIRNVVVYRQMYPLGHMSFSLAKDMDWFRKDAVQLIDMYATNVYSAFLQ